MVDLNDIAALEKAIEKKYGKDATLPPRAFWTPEKEKEYQEQIKEVSKRLRTKKKTLLGDSESKELITESKRICPYCKTYSFNHKDDLYLNKYGCCWGCYVMYIEGREERWLSGWRPGEIDSESK